MVSDGNMEVVLKIRFFFRGLRNRDKRRLALTMLLFYYCAQFPLLAEESCKDRFDLAADKFLEDPSYLELVRKGAAAEQRGNQQELLDTLKATLAEIAKRPKEEEIQKSVVLPEYITVTDDLREHHLADGALRELLDLYVKNCDSRDEFVIAWMLDEAEQRSDVGSIELVSDLYRLAIAGLEAQSPPNTSRIGKSQYDYGIFLLNRGQPDQALKIHLAMLDSLEKKIGRRDERFGGTLFGLAQRYQDAKAYIEAERLLTKLQGVAEDSTVGLPLVRVIQTYDAKGRLFVDMKRVKEAEAAFSRAFELAKGLKDTDPASYAIAVGNLQRFRQIAESLQDDAETAGLREEFARAEATYGILDHRTSDAREILVEQLQKLGRTSAIEALGNRDTVTDKDRPAATDGTYDDLLKQLPPR